MFCSSDHFSESPEYFTGACGVLRFCWCFTTPGQIPLYPGWVICAIWINGSEFEPLRVWFVNLTYPADEKVRCHFRQRRGTCVWRCIRQLIMLVQFGNLDFNSGLKQQMKVLEERRGAGGIGSG
jgi:hypothetical protein